MLGRPTAPLWFRRAGAPWFQRVLEDRAEVYAPGPDGAARLLTVVDGLHVHDVHLGARGLLVTASGGFWGPLSCHLLAAPGDGTPAVALNVRLPLATAASAPWRGGLATLTAASVTFIPGVLAP